MNKILVLILFCFILNSQCVLSQDVLQDDFVDNSLQHYVGNTDSPKRLQYDYNSLVKIPIILNSKDVIRSRDAVDNKKYDFVVKDDVFYNGKCVVSAGTNVTGRLELMTTKGMNGIPAMMIFDDFEIPGVEAAKLKSTFVRRGLDLTLLVLPVKWALTILPPTGSLTNFIMGGPAKLSPKNDIVLYYYPDWVEIN